MKRIIFKITVFMFCASCLHAQMIDSSKVPQVIRLKLKRMYPTATNVKWGHECYSQSIVKDTQTITRQLCFRASFPYKKEFEVLHFDSTSTWYQDDEDAGEPEDLITAPQTAIDKSCGKISGQLCQARSCCLHF